MNKPFTGDLDALMKRRSIRVAVQMYKYGKVLRSSIVYSLPLRTDRVLSWRLTVPLKQRWQWHIWS